MEELPEAVVLDLTAIQSISKAEGVSGRNTRNPDDTGKNQSDQSEFESEYAAGAPETGDTQTDPKTGREDAAKETSTSGESDGVSPEATGEITDPTDVELMPTNEEISEDSNVPENADAETAAAPLAVPTKTDGTRGDGLRMPDTKPLGVSSASKAEKVRTSEMQKQDLVRSGTTAENIVLSNAAQSTSDESTVRDGNGLLSDPSKKAAEALPISAENAAHKKLPGVSDSAHGKQTDLVDDARIELPKSSRLSEVDVPRHPDLAMPRTDRQRAPVQQFVLQSMQNNMQLSSKDTTKEIASVIVDLEGVGASEARGASPLLPASAAVGTARPDTPVLIARQMVEALQRGAERPVEIALSPKELGRVRMSISAAEAGITVNVVAERPETLDLMRRNIDQLSREFQSIGYESIDFTFSEGQAEQSFDDEANNQSDSPASGILQITTPDDTEMSTSTLTVTTGVDIRL